MQLKTIMEDMTTCFMFIVMLLHQCGISLSVTSHLDKVPSHNRQTLCHIVQNSEEGPHGKYAQQPLETS
jgi:hypothetical protein